jgi:hypothetical protein
MRCAIGELGGAVRQYVTAPWYMMGEQVATGEVAVPTSIEGPATIADDGGSVIPDEQPEA